ncbi:MAG: hypothetical protein Q8830_02740, partial [Candidatus Phytoplasma australasiaticum]|nr:hypothetical protein [Candidatus Phytoplasma australasiaticum]
QLQIKDTDLVVKQNGSLVIIGKHLVDIIKKIDSCSLEAIKNSMIWRKSIHTQNNIKFYHIKNNHVHLSIITH